jgi:hypothetical protein
MAASLALAGCGGAVRTVSTHITLPGTQASAETLAGRLVENNCHVRVVQVTCRPAHGWACTVQDGSGGTTKFNLAKGGFFCHQAG